MENLNSIVFKSQDLIRNNDGLTTSDAFEEITKILFTSFTMKLDAYTDPLLIRNLYKTKIYKKYNFFINEEISLSDGTISEILILFQNISFDNKDIKGKLFETYLGRTFTSGLGQFFTPRNIVDFIVKYAYSILENKDNLKILDPACGSGGMLISTSKLFNNCDYYGFDINERISRVAKMNMNINGIENYSIINDSFLNSDKFDFYDFIITNPPFGVKEKKFDILKNFTFGKNKKQVDLEILFLEKIIYSLKQGGICAIVLPDGIFNNSSSKKIREYLITYCNIIASIDLPSNVFKTSGTGCETSILFFKKKKSFDKNDLCKLYKVNYVGYETSTKFAKKIDKNDLDDIISGSFLPILKEQTDLIKRMDAKYYIRIEDNKKYKDYLSKYFTNKTEYVSNFNNFSEIKYIQYSDIDSNFGRITGYEILLPTDEIPNRAKFLIKEGDILIPRLSASNEKIALVTSDNTDCIASSGFFVLTPKNISSQLLFKLLRKPEILQQFKDFSSGTIMPGMDDSYLNEIKFDLPSEDKIKEIEDDIKKAEDLIKQVKILLDK